MQNVNQQQLSNLNNGNPNENPNHENPNHENLDHNENLNQGSPIKKAPVSDRKLQANRRNAMKSTGPLSELGKSYSRMNALSHSVYAQKVRLDLCHEDPQEFADMCRLMQFELSASGIAENLEAERIAMFHWKLARLWRYENAMMAIDMKDIKKKGSGYAEGDPEIDGTPFRFRCFWSRFTAPKKRPKEA